MGTDTPADAVATDPNHALKRLEPFVLIAVGGFVGAVARHALSTVLPTATVPWGTLATNVLGAFALGVLLYEARFAGQLTPQTRLIVGTGFLSSFTTYSTFAVETTRLAPTGAVANVGLTYGLGFAAVVCGRQVAGWIS